MGDKTPTNALTNPADVPGPSAAQNPVFTGDPDNNPVKTNVEMKRHIGLLEGIAIILGIIFGSGIFISPKGVITQVGAVGTSLIIWVVCGLLSMIGALCYAELGTMIPKSGGDYAYILEAYGPIPAFLFLWDAMVIFVPTTNAIMALTFASYCLQPLFFETCQIPKSGLQLIAACTICFLTFLNACFMKVTMKLQNAIMFTKIAALVIVIIMGIHHMAQGNTSNFDDPFENSATDPGRLSLAFYSGIFSYAGWNYLNFMTEELRNPYKNLPRAIFISLPLVTLIYVLANMAYLAVLTPFEMMSSNAVAVTFGNKLIGKWAFFIPILVAISTFGALSVHIMTTARIGFVGARNGHMPAFLSHINIDKLTPVPSLIFLCGLSLIMLLVGDVYVLITYSSIVESFFIMLSISAVIHFRIKKQHLERPIKVWIVFPIFYVIVCVFLIIVPIYVAPIQVCMGIFITLLGLPVYFLCVHWKKKPKCFRRFIIRFTYVCQKLFLSAKEKKND